MKCSTNTTSYGLMVLLSSSISLLIFCLVGLSIVEREMLKPPTVIVDLSSPPSILSLLLHIFYSSTVCYILMCGLFGGLILLSLYNVPLCLW